MRRTKIVCTIGPKTCTTEALLELAKGGMNIVRLNMSHGTHEWHKDVMDKVKQINAEGKYSLALMLDTKGPEIRSGDLKQPLTLKRGDKLTFTIRKEAEYKPYETEVNYDGFIDDVSVGDIVLVDSGVINLKVVKKTETDVIMECLDDGVLTSRRHLNIRGKSANLPAITEKDWVDIDFGIREKVDFFALSFVNSGQVVRDLKNYIHKKKSDIKIISKIESTQAMVNMEDIIDASDAIMVARGDLGAELPIEEVPLAQRDIVKYCRKTCKPVIVATQLLESMMVNPTPTRAEVTDIYHAVHQRTDAIMMSGETANGNYPFKALEVMHTVAKRTEQTFVEKREVVVESSTNPKRELALGACVIANNIKADAIIAFSLTGETANLISQCRPNSPIYAFAGSDVVKRQLVLSWGIQSFSLPFNDENPELTIEEAIQTLKKKELVKKGDQVVIVSNILSYKELVHAVQVRTVK